MSDEPKTDEPKEPENKPQDESVKDEKEASLLGGDPPKDEVKEPEKDEGDAGNKDAEPKTEENKKEESKVPEKYELKLPENSPLEQGHIEKIAAYAREQGFSNEQAQQILERESQAVTDHLEGRYKEATEQAEQWVSELGNDKEIGGDQFKENVELGKRVIHRYGSDELREQLDATGLGNYPPLVRMLVKIGKQMAEDKLRLGNTHSEKEDVPVEKKFYPSHYE